MIVKESISMEITIYFDFVCPWCWIGKTRLLQELEHHLATDELLLNWQPFQLNPTMSEVGMARQRYLEQKFTSIAIADQVYEPIRKAGTEAGLIFNFETICMVPNSMKAHAMLDWAQEHFSENTTQLADAIFKGYFQDGQDIGLESILLDIANNVLPVKLNDLQAKEIFDQTHLDLIARKDAMARDMDIQGVPFFVINDAYSLAGAQPGDVWRSILDL